jgi:two-component system, cell cycle sensor histidine kinase and response regulator CckA
MWPTQEHEATRHPMVMVVDNEAAVRDLQCHMLRQAGYEVMPADDAEKALKLVAADHRLDLVIADVHMPEMNGDEMARRIRALRPDVKILFVTGYSDTLFTSQPVLWADQAYLDKPFTRKGLLEAVSLLLYGNTQHMAS